MRFGLIITLFCLFAGLTEVVSQDLFIRKATDKIVIDGVLNESTCEQAEIAKDFWQYFPYDSSLAADQSEVRVSYDDEFIYVGAKLYRNGDQSYVTPSLRRDYRGPGFDGFNVILDS